MKRLLLSALFAAGLVAGIEAAPEDAVTQADLQAIFERLTRLEAENKAQAERIAELESQNRELISAQAADKRDLLAAQKACKDQIAAAKEDNARAIAAMQESSRRELAAVQESYKKDLAASKELCTDETTEKSESGRIFTTETGKKYYLADATARIFEPLSESGLQITPYGYLVFEGVYSTKGLDADWSSDFVHPKGSRQYSQHNSSLSMADSILGLQFDTPESVNGWKFTGRAEFDLAGGNADDYRFHWRHLYVDAQHESGWSILFGQTWHLWKMVTPSEIDGAWMENTGHPYRRSPQIRVTKKWDIDDESSLEVRAGFVKNGPNASTDRDDDGTLDSVASAWGWLEGAVIYDHKAAWEEGDRRWLVGLAGLYGRDKSYRWSAGPAWAPVFSGETDEYDSKMVMLAASVPFLDKFTLTGQIFAGDNLGRVQAGCAQSVAYRQINQRGREVSTVGGFLDLTYDINDTWSLAGGYGFDDPVDSETEGVAHEGAWGIYYNDRAYVDVFYNITSNFKLCLEYAHLRTRYADIGDSKAERLQFSAFYDF